MLYLFVVTEVLSVCYTVRFVALFVVWTSLDIMVLMIMIFQFRKSEIPGQEMIYDIFRRLRATIYQYPYYLVIVVIGATVLWLAYKITPYNWDSMTYHLPRIEYWVQNRSVEHYATNNIRQIASPMLGEFVNLHVYILTRGRDTLFNMLQAFSYLTCALMVERIADRLGCDRIMRFMVVLLYMTMPIAYAEALTTQVDNFATVWLLFYVYVLLGLAEQKECLRCESNEISKVCILGLCVAWGYLTKPSVCIAMVIFAIWLWIRCITRRDRAKELIRLILCVAPCVVLPIFPEILRNFKTFHAYASKSTGARQLVGTLQPAYLWVNFLKNFSFNMPTALVRGNDEFFCEVCQKGSRDFTCGVKCCIYFRKWSRI